MVEGHSFVTFTDHTPLTYAFQQCRDKCSPRQFHHLEFIGQFSTDFRRFSGQGNVADTLSRAISVMTPLDYHALANSDVQDAELQDILKNGSALRLERVPIPGTDVTLTVTHQLHNHGHSSPHR
jgi:hypothetical protein